MSSNEDPDISRIFSQKVDRRFQRDFGRLLHQQNHGDSKNQQRKSCGQQLGVKLVEAHETMESLHRQLQSRNEEIERLKLSENNAKEQVMVLQKQLSEMKIALTRNQHKITGKNFNENKTQEKLLLEDYRTALSKYKTWIQFANNQLMTMKTLLEELDGWTETNRYKIYFAYRGVRPEIITDDKVVELAAGSIIDYPGNIENVESITATQTRPKFRSTLTQTEVIEEEENLHQALPLSPEQSTGNKSLNNSFCEPSSDAAIEQMSAQELRLLDCEQQIERFEIQNARLREQLVILSDRAKHVELLEEQKQDLQIQLNIMRRQNDQIIQGHEQLKMLFGGGSITRNSLEELVRGAERLKSTNQELEAKLHHLETKKEETNVIESRRIAQLFKQKYERQIVELREKLSKYEPMYSSDTTRIFRFSQHNPLDEAHDEHLVKQVAASATANPLKRRKMEIGDASGADLTFLAEEDEEMVEPGLVRELRIQVDNVKRQLKQTEQNQTDFLDQYRELVTLLSGYDIRLGEDGFVEAENIHSRNCTFLFQKHQQEKSESSSVGGSSSVAEQQQQPTVDLLDNECARRWKDVLENYLVRYHSVPAFLSAVTISLVESPETPHSSRQSQEQESVSHQYQDDQDTLRQE